MSMKKRKGFTIIELIVVIAVIGILVLLAMPRFLGYVEKSQVTVIRHDVKVAEGKLAESLINGPTEFKSWDNNAKDLDGLVEERKLYETEGLVKKVEDGGGVEYNEETEDFTDYKIIPKSMRKEIGTKLKGEFYANSGGKVYYERDKAAKADKPEKEKDKLKANGCPIDSYTGYIPIDITQEMRDNAGTIVMPGPEDDEFIEMPLFEFIENYGQMMGASTSATFYKKNDVVYVYFDLSSVSSSNGDFSGVKMEMTMFTELNKFSEIIENIGNLFMGGEISIPEDDIYIYIC